MPDEDRSVAPSRRPVELPATPLDLFTFRRAEGALMGGVIALARLTGCWECGRRASGDVETMTSLDKIYWLYKAGHPVRRARRGSGLEELFQAQRTHRWDLPGGFRVSSEATLSAAGDLLGHAFLDRSRDSLYAEVSDLIFGADLAMANLECPIVPDVRVPFEFRLTKAPSLFYDPSTFDLIKGDGRRSFGFLSTACNHSLDFGLDGVNSTIRALRGEGIAFHGMNESEEDADRITIVVRNGIRIGLVSLTFGLNAHRPPPHRPWVVNRVDLNEAPERADLTLLARQLQSARREAAEFTIAQLHWGFEHEFFPSLEQVGLAHRIAEMGVDAIIGHHPHVIQPAEWYRTRRDPDRVVPVFYSLGNLINAFSAPYLCRSAVARLTLAKGTGSGGALRTYVKEARTIEVDQVADTSAGVIRLRPAGPPALS